MTAPSIIFAFGPLVTGWASDHNARQSAVAVGAAKVLDWHQAVWLHDASDCEIRGNLLAAQVRDAVQFPTAGDIGEEPVEPGAACQLIAPPVVEHGRRQAVGAEEVVAVKTRAAADPPQVGHTREVIALRGPLGHDGGQ